MMSHQLIPSNVFMEVQFPHPHSVFLKLHLLGCSVKAQGQLQPLLPLLTTDGELLPHPVEPRQSVTRGARRAAQGLTEDHGGLQQLPPVVVRALKEESTQKRLG